MASIFTSLLGFLLVWVIITFFQGWISYGFYIIGKVSAFLGQVFDFLGYQGFSLPVWLVYFYSSLPIIFLAYHTLHLFTKKNH